MTNRRTGNVFEKRLIETYIAENGTDPVNGEELTEDDLIELKTTRTVRPRPPTLTSIPALLTTFQNEWDAVALETYTLKQQLAQTRQELSTALYEYDAALRVIAKIQKERDEAREALSRITVSGGAVGDAMDVDGQALPEEVAAKVDASQQRYVHVQSNVSCSLANKNTVCQAHAGNDQYQRAGLLVKQSKHSIHSNRPNHSTLAQRHWLSMRLVQ